MSLKTRLQPHSSVSADELEHAIPWITRSGAATQGMETLMSGALLVAFALALDASNLVIGLMAAIPHISQLAQLPAIFVVEKVRNRRYLCIVAGFFSRPMALVMAAAVFLPAPGPALTLLLGAYLLRYLFGAQIGCSWNSWVRDLIPEAEYGRILGRRQRQMTLVGAVVTLLAAAFVDIWGRIGWFEPKFAYTVTLTAAFILGSYGTWCLTRIPEPALPERDNRLPVADTLRAPFRDPDFRRLLSFLGSWNFAVNLAAPFFTVHMLKRLELDLWLVVLFATISQITNFLTVMRWGDIADRLTNKSVLSVASPLFVLCIFGWTFTTMPDKHEYTIPLLVALHAIMGCASAGVTLASGNIAMKLAPRGNATAYLTVNSLVNSTAAAVASIIGGLTADFFLSRDFSLSARWRSPNGEVEFNTLSVQQWDFFFLMASIVALYSLHRLTRVREAGEVGERVVIEEFLTGFRDSLRNVDIFSGLRGTTELPFEIIRRALRGRSQNNSEQNSDEETGMDNDNVTDKNKDNDQDKQ